MNKRGIRSEPITPPTSPEKFDLSREIRVEGVVVVNVVSSCLDPSAIPDAIPLPTSSDESISAGEEEHCPYPWEVSIAFPPVHNSYLDIYLNSGFVQIMSEGEDQTSSSFDDYPAPDPAGGPANFYLKPGWRKTLKGHIDHLNKKYSLKGEYILYRPGVLHTILTPSPGCTAVYKSGLQLGLRFPLHPFIVELLSAYNLSICQLMPNSWASINSVLAICDLLRVRCTLTLWRSVMKLVEVSSYEYGPGWWSFQCRGGFKVVDTVPSNHRGFRHEFVFVYYGGEWGIPLVPGSEGPNFSLNRKVPMMSIDEAIVAIYLQKVEKRVKGQRFLVAPFWLPSSRELSDEHFLSSFGLSPAYPKDIARLKLDEEMAGRISASALLAAQIRKDLAAGSMKVPEPPKDPKKLKRKRAPTTNLVPTAALTKHAPKKVSRAVSTTAASGSKGSKAAKRVVPTPLRVCSDEEEGHHAPVSEDGCDQSTEYLAEEAPLARGSLMCLSTDDGSSKPFAELPSNLKNRRMSRAMGELFTLADDAHLSSLGKSEIDALHESWAEFSIRMTAYTRRCYSGDSDEVERLRDEIGKLQEKEKMYLSEVSELKKKLHWTESELDRAKRCLKNDEGELQQAKVDLAKAKEDSTILTSQRDSVNRALKDVKAELEAVKGRLKTSDARIGELLSSQNRLKEKIIEEWKNSEEGEAHDVEIGLEATSVVTSDTLRRVQLALAEFAPNVRWDEIQGKYDSILAKEREDLRAQLVAQDKGDSSDSDSASTSGSDSSSSGDDDAGSHVDVVDP
ncbi:uncharacterized protein [Spinacia oleracea]|uniref:Transposase (putative) gypsy type domain-containing protein n=1 Tax=Spinacia oleracea TaxID=3562 RepID=A0ABM3R7Z4_SPIOL|nr:uncharacterized protein LOC130467285 [Spinacia oleracea]